MKSKLKLYVMLKQAISPYSSQCVNAKGFYCERKEQEEAFSHVQNKSGADFNTEDKMNLKADSLKYFSS